MPGLNPSDWEAARFEYFPNTYTCTAAPTTARSSSNYMTDWVADKLAR
jgi:hypothetical protein